MSSFWRRLLCCGSQQDEEEAAELVIGQPFDFQKKVVVVEDGVLKVIPGPV
ncbi:hypothetical protein M436DRAFT_82853 [Aureobasidium namibiae CBS 147.97]|uniref:Uncharacterized protein n=1 Tax=Aureobasidium namibiae CBS 147.97 TaxID=1043004 RepID=A0A074XBB8_9PEZI|nr:uncharacterized protein M436DRAFT_82853 [Aureobasidium namibiae CBS 147.97]KEQ71936.1 hypothetical protein M436DRAFT_82853 [Aureobasidium namibiae CBS 147.97]